MSEVKVALKASDVKRNDPHKEEVTKWGLGWLHGKEVDCTPANKMAWVRIYALEIKKPL